jgi:hypothetical protein
MTRKTYRSAQGKVVDLGALLLQNENVRAVGNMGVNARGDLVDGWNRPINTRNQQVSKNYNRQISNVQDEPVQTSMAATAPAKAAKSKKEKIVAPPTPEDFDDDFVKPVEVAQAPAGGLAAAIAKAREIKQEPILSPRQAAQKKPGVSKI